MTVLHNGSLQTYKHNAMYTCNQCFMIDSKDWAVLHNQNLQTYKHNMLCYMTAVFKRTQCHIHVYQWFTPGGKDWTDYINIVFKRATCDNKRPLHIIVSARADVEA